MVAPEGAYLCVTALAESYEDESGGWRREDESAHPMLDEEVAYLERHGLVLQFI
jgi:hypothetical protein